METNDTSVSAEVATEGVESASEETVAEPVETKNKPRSFKLKVNGSEREVSEEELQVLLQKEFSADEKFQKAAMTNKEARKLIDLANKDPDAFLRSIGKDPSEYAKAKLRAELEELNLDPKERELREYKKKLADYEKQAEERKAKEDQERSTRAVAKWTEHYDRAIPEALSKAGLPASEDTIRLTADIMLENLELGVDLPLEHVMTLVKERHIANFKKLSKQSGEGLIDLMDEDTLEALINGYQKRKAKGKIASKPKAAIQAADESKPKTVKSEKEAMREFNERLERWKAE